MPIGGTRAIDDSHLSSPLITVIHDRDAVSAWQLLDAGDELGRAAAIEVVLGRLMEAAQCGLHPSPPVSAALL